MRLRCRPLHISKEWRPPLRFQARTTRVIEEEEGQEEEEEEEEEEGKMVAMPKRAWLPAVLRVGGDQSCCERDPFGSEGNEKLGILAFETARTMSRLVSLHRCLSESEVQRLRSVVMRSDGVAYLNSTHQNFLMRVACAEMVDDLDHAAEAISRLARRGRVSWPKGFDHVYHEIKAGVGDRGLGSFGLGFGTKEAERKMRKMEKYVAKTSRLYEEMEMLAELEASERKLERWKNYSGPMTAANGPLTADPPGADLLMKKLALQRKAVRRIQDESIWGKSYDKVIDLMTKATITIFAKICTSFGFDVPDLPVVVSDRDGKFRFAPNREKFVVNVFPNHASGPLERPVVTNILIANSGPLLRQKACREKRWVTEAMEPASSTLGGSGLAIRYADVVDLAEKMLSSPELVSDDMRKELYRLLPQRVRAAVRAKLRDSWRVDFGPADDKRMADGWSEAAGRILEWLGPMARDTTRWQTERSCERRGFAPVEAKVFALQTLLFADKEKTEAAVVEVLVGLSCVCRYNHGGCSGGREGWA